MKQYMAFNPLNYCTNYFLSFELKIVELKTTLVCENLLSTLYLIIK